MTSKEDWECMIRSTLISTKNNLSVRELAADIKCLEGFEVPYRQFGFKTFKDMVVQTPGIDTYTMNGDIYCKIKVTAENQHIIQMVQGQKGAKKKSSRKIPVKYKANSSNGRWMPNNKTRPNLWSNKQSNQNHRGTNNQYNRNVGPRLQSFSQTNQRYEPGTKSTPTPTINKSPPKFTPPPTPPPTPLIPTTNVPQKPIFRETRPTIQSIPPLVTRNNEQIKITVQNDNVPLQKPSVQNRLVTVQANANHDPRLLLMAYTKANGYSDPIYKTLPIQQSRKQKEIFANVSIEQLKQYKWKSYPTPASSEEEAQKLAAAAALKDLQKNIQTLTITQNHETLLKNILEIVNQYPNGIFESKVEDLYVEKYHEKLPQDWINHMRNFLNVDVGANMSNILTPRKPQYGQIHDTKVKAEPDTEPIAIEPGCLNLYSLDQEDDLWVYVNVAYNTSDIWGILIGPEHSSKLTAMAADMRQFYETNKRKPKNIMPGSYYAIFDDDWHRVRCIKHDKATKKVTVFFIDRGDEDDIPADKLYDLESRFCQLPMQSVQISMSGLERFSGFTPVNEFIGDVLLEKEVNLSDFVCCKKGRDVVISAELYIDTEQGPVNLNEQTLTKIMELVDPTPLLEIPKSNDPTVRLVTISHIDVKNIYAKILHPGLELLDQLINETVQHIGDSPAVRDINKDEIYLSKIEEKYYRVQVTELNSNDALKVLLIDEGRISSVKKKNLISLKNLPNFLDGYPKQAHRVILHKISPVMFDEKMAEHLREMTKPDDTLFMKCVGKMNSITVVELFKRMENNMMASLNDSLVLLPELTSPSGKEKKGLIRNDRTSLGINVFPIPAPKIDDTDYFNVHVTMSANPGNFTVQPHSTKGNLGKLMMDLSMHCRSYKGPPVAKGSVKVGEMYAAKYEDDEWYRAYVSQIIDSTVVAVYFCDFGDFWPVTIDRLQPLENRFYDFPYQAIKARLHGISPARGDWSVNDCLKFHKLVVGKNFASQIKAKKPDPKTGETVLELELIDVSDKDEDVFISELLITEKMAIRNEA